MKHTCTRTELRRAAWSPEFVHTRSFVAIRRAGPSHGRFSAGWLALLVLNLWCFTAGAQTILTNGLSLDGTLAVNATNSHTLTAAPGDRIVVQVAKLTGGAGFSPVLEVWSPDGIRLGVKSDGVAARIDLQADLGGTYTVLVHDLAGTGSGMYRVRLAQVPGVFETAVGDEGGLVTNGGSHQGAIDVGDLDLWTVQANPGDRLAFQISKLTGGAGFTPMIELFGPDGALLESDSGGVAARVDAQASVGGTYTLLVSDFTRIGSGTYELRPAQIPGAFTIPNGDEGGATVDGANQDGTISVGDLDLWTFSAAAGDLVTLQLTEQSGGANFSPMIEVFTPGGERKRVAQGAAGATLDLAIEEAGTYTVLVSDATKSGAGTYRLVVARGTVSPPAANILSNGGSQSGSISSAGETNNWTFTATAGESIVVRMGETAVGGLVPWLRLYGPDGVLLAQNFTAVAAEVTVRATNSGTFLVVAADGSAGRNQIGNYRIGLAKTGSPVVISASDEGGILTNGVTYLATISSGDLDAWTFTANAGESFVVRMGETTAGSTLIPWLRLYGPDGVLLDANFTAVAAEVTVRATNSGTFLVVAADGNATLGGTGNYRISLAKTGSPVLISPSDEGGALTNGITYLATIDNGDIDAWTFRANAGESFVVRTGETTAASPLLPWLRVYGPDGGLLDADFNAAAAEVTVRTTNSGTFLVVVADGTGTLGGTGNYRISLAKTGSQLLISPSDEGGSLTNGAVLLATIDNGDIDAWTFDANAGESIVVRMGETTAGSTLLPWLRLYGPDGVLLDADFNAAAAEVTVRATNSGTFTVVAADGNNGWGGTGNYRLSLAKTGSPFEISPSDEGGALINGATYLATIDNGDIDPWTFNASAGESIVVRMGETTAGSSLIPWLRLYGPNGVLLAQNFTAVAAEVSVRATNSGTFTVVAADGNNGWGGTGNYRISLAKTGAPLEISASDEGGTLTNGTTYLATIDNGDIDAWVVNADVGETIVVRMGEATAGSGLIPWLRLYGPNGVLLDSNFTVSAAEVTARATNSGTFLVVAADGNANLGGTGNYRISLAKAGTPLAISPGDEGGLMNGSGTYDGTIDTGDLDAWTFTACTGEIISLSVAESVSGSPLTPWIRLYGWNGELLKTVFGASSAVITNFVAPAGGTYTVVIGDGSSTLGNSGTYRLTVNGLIDQLRFCTPEISGTNGLVTVIGGTVREPFTLLSSTNVGTPLAQWTPLVSGQFDLYGVARFTNVFDQAEPHRFFLLRRP